MNTSSEGPAGGRPKTALAIAGLDPCGGAGIVADALTFRSFGLHPLSVAASLTYQSTLGVRGRFDVPADAVIEQVEALLSDTRPDAVKTGMLARADTISAVAEIIEREKLGPLVVDPVLASGGGEPLLDEGGVAALLESLIPVAALVTPNLGELAVLCGLELSDFEDAKAGALKLSREMEGSVLVTGVRLTEGSVTLSADILCDGEDFTVFTGPWVEGLLVHGTGCVLSSAICACGALGMDLESSVEAGRRYALEATAKAVSPGGGPPCANPARVDVRVLAGGIEGGMEH